MQRISALVRTYEGDDPDGLAMAIRSLQEQTRVPDEIVLVEDGPLTSALDRRVDSIEIESSVPLRRVKHQTNRGNGAACRTAIESASYEVVAIQDADDHSVPRRLEWSLETLREQDADVVGGYIEEFEHDPEEPSTLREVPCDTESIRTHAKLRNPVNHTTVLARKEPILSVGNYRDLGLGEDYELWGRLLAAGYKFVNIPKVLAKVRGGPDMHRRRGGIKHVREEFHLQRQLSAAGLVSRPRAAANTVIRSVPKVAPPRIRSKIITTFLRSSQPRNPGSNVDSETAREV